MKSKYLILAFLVFITFSSFTILPENKSVQHVKESWVLTHDKVEMFTILLPSSPVITEKEIKTEFGFIKGKGYFVSEPKNNLNIFYSVVVANYKGVNKYHEEELNEFFDYRRNGATANFNGKVILEEKVLFNNNQGRKYRILTNDDNLIVTILCCLVGEKLYMLSVVTPRKYDQNKNVDRFLDSFKILSKQLTPKH